MPFRPAASPLGGSREYPSRSVLQGAGIWRNVDGMFPKRCERNDLQCPLVSRCQDDRRCHAIQMSSQPVRGGDTPSIAWHESGKLVSGHWRAQIVADAALMLKELTRDHRADCVTAEVLGAGVTTSVSVKPGDRVITAGLQLTAKHVAVAHRRSIPCPDAPTGTRVAGFRNCARRNRAAVDSVPFRRTAGTTSS
jgi:hypothetical protein